MKKSAASNASQRGVRPRAEESAPNAEPTRKPRVCKATASRRARASDAENATTTAKTPQKPAPRRRQSASKLTSKRKELCAKTLEALARQYPEPRCALEYETPFQLMVAVVLSAQCTDKRVNMVTPGLFRRFPTPEAFAAATVGEIEEEIKSCGFYHAKAVNLSGAAKTLVEKHGGIVPDTMEELVQLPGVGRKTANCILGNAFRIASGFVVDTHVLRLSRKIGLSDNTTPEKVEADLNALVPQSEWIDASHRLILLGREFCVARRPQCDVCPLAEFCLKRE